ncbi:MAG: signal peptidase [Acidimicrobiaceae bacterium]|nr:signal peptidase [Acidimicrobiaceae bacterium]
MSDLPHDRTAPSDPKAPSDPAAPTALLDPGVPEEALDASPTTKGNKSGGWRTRKRRILIEWAAVFALAALAAAGLRGFVLQAFYVPSGSMEPALQIGDRILVDKFLFSPASLHDGDVIVFARPSGDTAGVCDDPNATDLVKRVVALPGQTIWSSHNKIYVNGIHQTETYLPRGTALGKAVPRQVVPKGRFFVMGDNRSLSCDSRYWGTVKASSIIGRVIAVIWRGGRPTLHAF